jgi:hypothetical protein
MRERSEKEAWFRKNGVVMPERYWDDVTPGPVEIILDASQSK